MGLMFEFGDNSFFCFDVVVFRWDGFGWVFVFGGMVVEIECDVVGYLFYYFGYNMDIVCW